MNINPTDTPFGPPDPDVPQADPNSGVGWYEFITPTATTGIAYVHESGDVYVPGGGWAPTEPFHLAASRGNVHRLIRADVLDVEEMAHVIADHGSRSTYGEIGVACSCGADLGAIPLDPDPQTTPQEAREGGKESLEGVAGGERTSQGADGAAVRSLGDRLRSAADYQDRPGAYDELRAMADEADRLERERHEAGGHYHRVVGKLSALQGRLDATRGDLAAQEGIAQELREDLGAKIRLTQEQARVIERLRPLVRKLGMLPSTYTRAPGENGDRVADLLSQDAYRLSQEMTAILDGGMEADHVHDWQEDTTYGDSAKGVRHYCCTLPGCTAQREETRP